MDNVRNREICLKIIKYNKQKFPNFFLMKTFYFTLPIFMTLGPVRRVIKQGKGTSR